MIVPTAALDELAGRVAMVSGGFDPLHTGHIEYFRAAARLGPPLLCNVSTDGDVERKHAPLLPQRERAEIIDALRLIAYTHLATGTTEEVLRRLRPRTFVKGADWRDRLPEGELRACTELGIEVVFVDTVITSSSVVLEQFLERERERASALSRSP